MGEVYRARDSRLGRDVAVKVLPERLAADPDAMARFHREARAVAALSHQNIVAIHDFGDERSVVYVVLELLEGETLRAFLGKGSGGWRAGVEWVAAAAEAIDAVHVDSIAVLPFTNAGGGDAEYLSDGIAESLINNLARIRKLRVVPRSTVFRYKGTDLDSQILGRELQARLLLTGKVMQRGDRLMVQADLVDATERQQLWGERFNRPSADIFEVEDEIARHIVEKLRLKLSGDESRQLGDRHTDDPTAYDLYLKARHHWDKRTPQSTGITDYVNASGRSN